MDKVGEKTGWLVIFDRRKAAAWEEKLCWKTEVEGGRTIHVVGHEGLAPPERGFNPGFSFKVGLFVKL